MRYWFIILLYFTCKVAAQNKNYDSIYGRVQSVREKLYFLDTIRQNYKLYEFENEYGHHGFMSREFTLNRFSRFWYKEPFVHYVNYYREYDSLNQIIKEQWYHKDNAPLITYTFKYNQDGNCIERVELEEFFITTTKKAYNYDKRLSAQLKEWRESEPLKVSFQYENFEYNKEGLLVKKESFDDIEGRTFVKVFYYLGNKIAKTIVERPEGSGKLWQHFEEFDYDGQGNRKMIKTYALDVAKNTCTEPKITAMWYDGHNNMTGKTIQDVNWLYEYDANGNLLREKVTDKNGLFSDFKCTYKKGLPDTFIHTESNVTTKVSFSYKFDCNNNWTEQTKYINGKPLFVRKREIKYYE